LPAVPSHKGETSSPFACPLLAILALNRFAFPAEGNPHQPVWRGLQRLRASLNRFSLFCGKGPTTVPGEILQRRPRLFQELCQNYFLHFFYKVKSERNPALLHPFDPAGDLMSTDAQIVQPSAQSDFIENTTPERSSD
jgi:hypothetical protein